MKATIGQHLHKLRNLQGKTLADVSRSTGLSVSFLSDLERTKSEPSLATLRTLALEYGTYPADILRSTEDPRCYLPHAGKCCCTCKHHKKDMSHPNTDGGSISSRRGWVCAWPELRGEGVFSGWGEHGMCECHEESI